MNDKKFKSGYVGIIGIPNVGKTTLLNALIGQKIAIISPKPQTTRGKILGIMSEDDMQVIFLDTPGFHKPKNKLGETMIKAVNETIGEADFLLVVVEPTVDVRNAEAEIIEKSKNIPAVLVINKCDTVKKEDVLPVIEKYSKMREFKSIIPISAKTGDGIGALKEEIKKYLPEGPMYYPEDMVTDQPEKQIVAEIIREKTLLTLDKEVPHGIAVEIVKMKEEPDLVSISANIFCEKDSHKGIIIGSGGKTLKRIGSYARKDCEKLLDKKVFLELWVKVKKDWRNSNFLMKEFGLKQD